MSKAALLLGLVAILAVPVVAADSLGVGLLNVPGLSAYVQNPSEISGGWNAGLSYNTGKLGINAGYLIIDDDSTDISYVLSGNTLGSIRNARGASARISYSLTRKIVLSAAGEVLTHYDPNGAARLRQSVVSSNGNYSASTDRLTHWRAGIQYGIGSSNAISLGYEEGSWDGGNTSRERYITIGLDHSLSRSSNLKLLYQISDYQPGEINLNGDDATLKSGVASAQLEIKF